SFCFRMAKRNADAKGESGSEVCKRLNQKGIEAGSMGALSKCQRLSSTLDEALRHSTGIDTELFHAGDQSGALQTHAGGCTVSSAHASSGFLQDAQELFPLVGVRHCGHSLLCGTVAEIRDRNLKG